jgi:hypothetical protein
MTAMLVAAAIGAIPAFADVVDHFQSAQSTGIPPWAVLALLIAALELAYLVLLVQIRQRAAFVAVRMALLVVAMAYASLLGLSLFGGPDSATLSWLGLSAARSFARIWSFAGTSVTSVAAMLVERGSPGRVAAATRG